MSRPLTAETIEGLFDIASRAPSVRNTQPWLPRLTGITKAGVHVHVRTDAERTLPVTDPHGADLGMSLGCWVEACAIAAAAEDFRLQELVVSGERHDITLDFVLAPAGTAPARTAPAATEPAATAPRGDEPGSVISDKPEVSENSVVSEISAGFSVSEVLCRQVDRGRLRRDTAAVEAAVAEYVALRPHAVLDRTAHGEIHRQDADGHVSGIVIAQVPEAIWAKAARYAQSAPFEPRAAFDETLRWLRLDDRDPRYREDGLTAEALRLSRGAARLIAGVLGGDEAPDAARDRLRDMLVTAGAWSTMLPTFTAPRAPERLVLGIEARHASEVSAERWVLLGRELMRLWLIFARHGLRVSVESQLTGVQLPAAMLADVLRRTAPARGGMKPVYQPFTAFTVGRSTGAVPRSPRLR